MVVPAFCMGCCIFGAVSLPLGNLGLMLMNSTTTSRRSGQRCLALATAALFGALVQPAAQAQGGVYLCLDANGRKVLTDSYKTGCKTLDIASSIPAPSGGGAAPRRATPRPSTPVTTPADFPKVDNALQRARDSDRREILTEELASEQRRLADMRAEFKDGQPDRLGNERNYAKYQERVANLRDNIGRAERNVEALQREIGNIK